MREEFQTLINPYTGIVTHVNQLPREVYEPDVSIFGAQLNSYGIRSEQISIGAAAWTDEAAFMGCIGEAVERHQPYPLKTDKEYISSTIEWGIDEDFVDPSDWVLFSSEQYSQKDFPFKKLTNAAETSWSCFRDYATGAPVWIPTEMGFLYPGKNISHKFCSGISTGLAAGRKTDPVVLWGLQEVIERDAIVGAWWEHYPLKKWDSNYVFELLGEEISQRVNRPNLKYEFYTIDSPYSSNVAVVSLEGEEKSGFIFSVGASCKSNLSDSFKKALLEAIQGRPYIRFLKQTIDEGKLGTGIRVPSGFAEHAMYYSLNPEKIPQTVLKRAKDIESIPSPLSENKSILLEKLQKRVLFRSMSPVQISKRKDQNWQVVKVVVPGLQPLHAHHDLPCLGGKAWGSRTLADYKQILPHPFP